MFLMLGAIYGVCGLVATLLISEPEDSASETMSFTSADSEKSEEAARGIETSLRPTEVLRTAVFYQVLLLYYVGPVSLLTQRLILLDFFTALNRLLNNDKVLITGPYCATAILSVTGRSQCWYPLQKEEQKTVTTLMYLIPT